MTTPEPEIEIARFLARYNAGQIPDADADLFEIGALTSLVAMQLVLLIEKRWSFEVPISELRRENCSSMAAVCALVRRCREDPEAVA